ncbi:hypothetical protein AAMO2058_000071600 [Amorphochlora amoebiformis]
MEQLLHKLYPHTIITDDTKGRRINMLAAYAILIGAEIITSQVSSRFFDSRMKKIRDDAFTENTRITRVETNYSCRSIRLISEVKTSRMPSSAVLVTGSRQTGKSFSASSRAKAWVNTERPAPKVLKKLFADSVRGGSVTFVANSPKIGKMPTSPLMPKNESKGPSMIESISIPVVTSRKGLPTIGLETPKPDRQESNPTNFPSNPLTVTHPSVTRVLTHTPVTPGVTDVHVTTGVTGSNVTRGGTNSPVRRGVTGFPVTRGGAGSSVTWGDTGSSVTPGVTGFPVTRGGAGSSVTWGDTGSSVTPGVTGFPVTRDGAGSSVTRGDTGSSVTPGVTGFPVTRGGAGSSVTRGDKRFTPGVTGFPVTRGGTGSSVTRGDTGSPVTPGVTGFPVTRGSTDSPFTRATGLTIRRFTSTNSEDQYPDPRLSFARSPSYAVKHPILDPITSISMAEYISRNETHRPVIVFGCMWSAAVAASYFAPDSWYES